MISVMSSIVSGRLRAPVCNLKGVEPCSREPLTPRLELLTIPMCYKIFF